MNIRITKGDVFKVKLENGINRYFQFIGKDASDLNGDVIAIFKKQYAEESVSPEMIVNDETECFMHTSVRAGFKLGLWERAFSIPVKFKEEEIFFRDSLDYGFYPRQHIVSHNWDVWSMNGERRHVGALPREYHNAAIGGVYAPIHVINRLETGEEPAKYYPDY